MKVVVTGCCGMIGSWIAEKLFDRGWKVLGLDDLSGGDIRNITRKYGFQKLDLRDYEATRMVITQFKPDVIYHLAANAREGASAFQPASVVSRNSGTLVNVLSAGIQAGMSKFVYTSCHDDKTRLVTTNGIKSFDQILPDDMVYTIDPGSGNLEIKSINEIIINDYEGKMITFEGRASLCVTPNHRMMYVKGPKGASKLSFEEASISCKRALLKLPVANWEGMSHGKLFHLPGETIDRRKQPNIIYTKDLFYLTGLFIADGVCGRYTSISKRVSSLNRAERIVVRNHKGQFEKVQETENQVGINTSERITFCVPRGDKARRRLEETLSRNAFSFNCSENTVDLSSSGLFEIFSDCGKGAHNKHVPSWMLDASIDLLTELFDGIIDGDGHRRQNGGRAITTVSYRLVRDCIEIGVKTKQTTTFKFHKGRPTLLKDGRVINGKGAYYISIGRTEPVLWQRRFSNLSYKGKVWCLNVDNGNFLIERDGRCCFSGNSIAVYGHAKPPFTELYVKRPIDIYGLQKAAGEDMIEMLAKIHGFSYAIARPHNMFGERQALNDRYRNVIGIWMNQIMREEPLTVYGDGTMSRAWSYIGNSAGALLRLADNDIMGIYNIGSDYPCSLNEAMLIVKEAMEVSRDYRIKRLPERYGEVKHAYCSHLKAKVELGLIDTNQEHLINGIGKMADWAKRMGPQEWYTYDEIEIKQAEKLPENWR